MHTLSILCSKNREPNCKQCFDVSLRLKKAKYFDYILMNDQLDRACAEISKVVGDFIKS